MLSVAGCEVDIFGPDSPSTRSTVQGVVTSAVDGSPIEGARVFPTNLSWVWYSGDGIPVDTAVTDADGRYRLETEHFCPAQIAAEADGYVWTRSGPRLSCASTQPVVEVDVVLPPLSWAWSHYEPAWSPRGAEIAVSSNRPDLDGYHIHLIDTLGSAAPLINSLGGSSPSWSPTGLDIAFVGGAGSFSSIFVARRDGSGSTEFRTSHQIAGIAWSPVSDTIAFWTLGGGVEAHIYLFDINTAAVTRLTEPGSHNTSLSWSPDGSQVVFSSNRSGVFQIHRMDADGSNVVQVSDVPEGGSDPAWSPCGGRIAFTSRVGGTAVVRLMESDGSNVGILAYDGNSPTWSPDCSSVAFTSSRGARVDGAQDVWIINVDGSGPRKLTRRE